MTQQTAQPIALDPSFGNDGVCLIKHPSLQYFRITSVGPGPDGKLYFSGHTMAGQYGYILGRLHSNGDFDTTFGDQGLVRGNFLGQPSVALSFAILKGGATDGYIVLSGRSEYLTRDHLAFARFDPSGILDPRFGTRGISVLDIELTSASSPSSEEASPATATASQDSGVLALLPDGKMLAFKQHTVSTVGQSFGLLVRVDHNGFLDKTFNQVGYTRVIHPSYSNRVTSLMNIRVQADGNYMGCGQVWDRRNPGRALFVRYTPDGNLDPSFGADGFTLIDDKKTAYDLRLMAMTHQPNGRTLGAGVVSSSPHGMGLLTSIEPDGALNIQFNGAEPLFTSLDSNHNTEWTGCATQKDNKIVVVGYVGRVGTDIYSAVARVEYNGTLDPAFNNGAGWGPIPFNDKKFAPTGMALQDDGKLLVSAEYGSSAHGAIVRCLL